MALTKLTLTVEDTVIEQAREYSQRHNTSISRLVNGFLAGLAAPETSDHPPVLRRLIGIIPATTDERDYLAHLDAKYRA